jgi:hypothetical protein
MNGRLEEAGQHMADHTSRPARSMKKKDQEAPRGLFRQPAGGWAIRFTYGSGQLYRKVDW